jgi:hypothetical protein
MGLVVEFSTILVSSRTLGKNIQLGGKTLLDKEVCDGISCGTTALTQQ